MNKPEINPLDEVVQLHVAQLMEHFDSVRVICTAHDGGLTSMHTHGGGNIYAQEGSVKDWIIRMNAFEDERSRTRVEIVDDDDDDDDEDPMLPSES